MYIETERLIIRDFVMDDLGDLFEILSDETVMEHCEPPYDMAKTERFLREFCVEREPKGAVAAELDGKVVGYILFKAADEPEIYEIGWIFNKDYWGRGYAFEACSAVIEHGFGVMGLHKICAETDDGVKSLGLMKKLGMSVEGVFRQHSKQADGTWRDLFWAGIIRG